MHIRKILLTIFLITTTVLVGIQYLTDDNRMTCVKNAEISQKSKKDTTLQTAIKQIYILFPEQSIIDIQPLTGGLSGTSLYKVTLKNEHMLVVRLIYNRSKEDQKREIYAQKIASRAGYGPKVYETNEEDGYIIMEFLLPEKSLLSHDKKLEMIGKLLKKMHHGATLLPARSIFDEIEHLYLSVNEKLIKIFDESVIEKIRQQIQEYRTQWQHDQVAAHRDCNPNNIIFSDENVYLIDFENAAQDDPYFDMATVGIFQIFTPTQEQIFLDSYFKRKPTKIEKERYQFMRKVAFLYYALTLLTKISDASFIKKDHNSTSFNQIIEHINQKQFDLNTEENRFDFALSMLNEIK